MFAKLILDAHAVLVTTKPENVKLRKETSDNTLACCVTKKVMDPPTQYLRFRHQQLAKLMVLHPH
jgi:hypothetical protein